MKANTPELMKFKRLQRRLKTSVAELCGLLELLWISTAKNAPQGDIGKFSNEDIAIGCYYEGDPDEFISALVECGWLDADPDHRLLVHDWCDHAPRWVVGNLKRHDRSIIVADRSQPTKQPTKQATKQPAKEVTKEVTRQAAIATSSKPSQVKPSQAKCVSSELLSRHTHSEEFAEAWQSWKNHQAENMNRITPTAEEASLMELARSLPDEADQIAAIRFSIARRAKHLITNGDHRRSREPPASANVSDDDLYSKIGKL